MNEFNPDLLGQLQSLLRASSAAPAPTPTAGWNAPSSASQGPSGGMSFGRGQHGPSLRCGQADHIQGVAVPLRIPTPLGEVRCYVWLDGTAASSPQAMQGAIQSMARIW